MSGNEQVAVLRQRVDLCNHEFEVAVRPWQPHCDAHPAFQQQLKKVREVMKFLRDRLRELEQPGADVQEPVVASVRFTQWAVNELNSISVAVRELRDKAEEALMVTLHRSAEISIA
jgi:hypothetical protein